MVQGKKIRKHKDNNNSINNQHFKSKKIEKSRKFI